MQIRNELWEVTFIVEGVHLPQEQITVGNFGFEKLSGKESLGMWLPVRCVVRVRGSSEEVEALARRSVQDFLGIYSVIGEITPGNLICREARRIEGRVSEKEGGVVDHIVYGGGIRVIPDWSKEKSSEILNVSEIVRNSVNLDIRRNSFLRISLDYLRHAGQVDSKENKLIDCMIGLEALYLKETQELSYRLSHRVASLLGNTDEERRKVFKNVKRLYKKRSKLVHGESVSVSWDEVKLVRKYLRESIKRFLALSQQYSRDSIIRELDLGVIDETKRIALQKDSKDPLEKRWGTIAFE